MPIHAFDEVRAVVVPSPTMRNDSPHNGLCVYWPIMTGRLPVQGLLRKMAWTHRLRKDPLDPIDGGAKVKLAWQRVTNPKAAEAAAQKRKQAEAEEKKAKEAKAKSQQKSGSWGGLPGKR